MSRIVLFFVYVTIALNRHACPLGPVRAINESAGHLPHKGGTLKAEARSSETLWRYGYCEADLWTTEEASVATSLVDGLNRTGRQQYDSLVGDGRRVLDSDSWVWGMEEPDFVGLLATEVLRVAGNDVKRKALCEHVANRLLDRVRVRALTEEELEVARALMRDVDVDARLADDSLREHLLDKVETMGEVGAEASMTFCRGLAQKMIARILLVGTWDERIDDGVPAELQPLHMSAVREALRALIPARLHKSLDAAVAKGKDDFGEVRGGSVLCMDGWRVSVRAEDALSRGRLQEDALEFFLKMLQRVCQVLRLPLAIGSKTVGREVGRQENPVKLARVMEHWRKVWAHDEVRSREELLLVVAVDERDAPQDWVFVTVRSVAKDELFGDASQLVLRVYDRARRGSVGRRVARNVDVLVRGVIASTSAQEPVVEFAETPECRMASQRILCAFGLLLGRVAFVGEQKSLDPTSESFVPDVSHILRALFVKFRTELGERGWRDASRSLDTETSCREVLQKLSAVPSLTRRGQPSLPGAGAAAPVNATSGSTEAQRLLRVVTWNRSSFQRSAIYVQCSGSARECDG